MELKQYRTKQLNKCAFLSNIMSRRMKGLRSYRTCKLPSESATMSWMLPEDKRLLDQRQRSLSPKVWLAAQASCSCCLHLSSMSTGTRWNGTHECWGLSGLHHGWETLSLKIPQTFIMGCMQNYPSFTLYGDIIFAILNSKQTCLLLQWSHYFYLPGCCIQSSLERKSKTKSMSMLLRCKKSKKPMENGLPVDCRISLRGILNFPRTLN